MQYADDTISDFSGKLTSKLFQKASLLEVELFKHSRVQKNGPMFPDGWRPQRVYNARTNLEWFDAKYVNDPNTPWVDYPVTSYNGMGMGYYSDMTEDRMGIKWKLSNNVKFFGEHEFTIGGDWVDNQTHQRYGYRGGHWQVITPYAGANVGRAGGSVPGPYPTPNPLYNPGSNPRPCRLPFLLQWGP